MLLSDMRTQGVIFLIGVAIPMAWAIDARCPSEHPEKFSRWILSHPVLVQGSAAIAAPVTVPARSPGRRFTPTTAYRQEVIHGFTVLINPEVLRSKPAAQELRQELARQLAAIARIVPVQPLAALRNVRIWVEWAKRPQGAAEFHPSATWLSQHGYNPEKAGAIEVSNARNFVQWSRSTQPWMLLHELAHAYHFLVVGDQNTGIESAYQHAVNQKLYASVNYIQGGKRKAYALTNAKEYFAELSEAYFGKNDFYPFTRSELKTYDPVGYQLMETVWGKSRKSALSNN